MALMLSVNVLYAHNDKNKKKENKKSDNEMIYAISGKIIDKNTGETLAGVNIKIEELGITIFSDLEGQFKIDNIAPGSYTITTNYISYENITIKQNIQTNKPESEILIKLNQ